MPCQYINHYHPAMAISNDTIPVSISFVSDYTKPNGEYLYVHPTIIQTLGTTLRTKKEIGEHISGTDQYLFPFYNPQDEVVFTLHIPISQNSLELKIMNYPNKLNYAFLPSASDPVLYEHLPLYKQGKILQHVWINFDKKHLLPYAGSLYI